MSTALPLKTPTKAQEKEKEAEKDVNVTPKQASAVPGMKVKEISSPHELTAFVETLLEQLDSKFDEMSTQILDRMSQMSTRVDALEASIQDIINGDISPTMPTSPIRRSGSDNGI
ncbi:hypothetical protein BDZ89DRAFT_984632 [Hymenopellis radicata]|nr:hypothetical protein BDZ89DRAFT_984632 [Hymenopellis radicata]